MATSGNGHHRRAFGNGHPSNGWVERRFRAIEGRMDRLEGRMDLIIEEFRLFRAETAAMMRTFAETLDRVLEMQTDLRRDLDMHREETREIVKTLKGIDHRVSRLERRP